MLGEDPNTQWTDDDPAAQIHAALQAVQTRTALDPATAKDGVKPLYLVLNTLLLAAATATRETCAQLTELADRGPAMDVHVFLAVPGHAIVSVELVPVPHAGTAARSPLHRRPGAPQDHGRAINDVRMTF